MGSLISLNNLKKVIAVGTVLSIAACFIPESAQAQSVESLFGYSGNPNIRETQFDFILDTSVTDSDTDPNGGKFSGAIQKNAKYTCLQTFGTCTAGESFLFNSGELIASPIRTSDDVTNYSVDAEQFIGGVKYEVTLQSESSDFIDLGILVKPSGNLDLINSLSNLRSVIRNDISNDTSSFYIGVRSLNSKDCCFVSSGSDKLEPIKVPEPNVTTPLLSVGTLGALSLLKRNRRSRISFEKNLFAPNKKYD